MNTVGTRWEHVGNTLGAHLVHDDFIEFYNLMGTRWEHVGNTLGAHLVHDDFIADSLGTD